jgi:hypothetical protein
MVDEAEGEKVGTYWAVCREDAPGFNVEGGIYCLGYVFQNTFGVTSYLPLIL